MRNSFHIVMRWTHTKGSKQAPKRNFIYSRDFSFLHLFFYWKENKVFFFVLLARVCYRLKYNNDSAIISRLLFDWMFTHHTLWRDSDFGENLLEPVRIPPKDYIEEVNVVCLLRLRVYIILSGNDFHTKANPLAFVFFFANTKKFWGRKTKGAKSGVYTKEHQTNYYRWIESTAYKCPWIQCYGTWSNNNPNENTIWDEPTFNYGADTQEKIVFIFFGVNNWWRNKSICLFNVSLARRFRDSHLILNKQ